MPAAAARIYVSVKYLPQPTRWWHKFLGIPPSEWRGAVGYWVLVHEDDCIVDMIGPFDFKEAAKHYAKQERDYYANRQ